MLARACRAGMHSPATGCTAALHRFRSAPQAGGTAVKRLGFGVRFAERASTSVRHEYYAHFVRRWCRVPKRDVLGQDCAYVGVVTPKTVDARAGVRTLARRRVYSVAASLIRSGQAPRVQPGDILLYHLNPSAVGATTAALTRDVRRSLQTRRSGRAAAGGRRAAPHRASRTGRPSGLASPNARRGRGRRRLALLSKRPA